MPAREAPIAIRNAISRRRPLKRTSNKLATLLHAISKTKLTAAKSVAKPARKVCVTSWGSVRRVVVKTLSILFRSEERRVGKELRLRWSTDEQKSRQ